MRRLIAYHCAGERLIATLDEAAGDAGLLIVSGGNEVRAGAHRGMAMLAADIAAAGHPVFRYDRRGVGDSGGSNLGFLCAAPDLASAVAEFRAVAPQVSRIIGFGNCDAATTLALFGRNSGIDRLLLANPWTIDAADAVDDDLPPVAAIRAHYADRLRDAREWVRVLRGGTDLGKLVRGLRKIAGNRVKAPGPLARRLLDALADWGDDASVLLARGDATAIAYRAIATASSTRTRMIDTDSHSFSRAADKVALRDAVLATLRA